MALLTCRVRVAALGALLVAAGSVLQAQTAPTGCSLPEDVFPGFKTILDTAMAQSPQMILADVNRAQAVATQYTTDSVRLPSLSGFIQYAGNKSAIADQASLTTTSSGFFYSMQVSQPLFQWGALNASVNVGRLQTKIAERNYVEAYRLLALNLRAQYLTLVTKKIYYRNQQHSVTVARENLDVLEAKVKNRTMSEGDLISPRLTQTDLEIAADRARADYDYSRQVFSHLAGIPEIPDAEVPGEMPKPVYSADAVSNVVAVFQRDGVDNTPQGQIYQYAIKQADLNYKIARVRLLPKFSMFAGVSQQNQTNAAATYVSQVAIFQQQYGVIGTWTLFDGFATRGAKRSALETKRYNQRLLKTLEETTADQIRNYAQAVTFAARALEVADTRRGLAEGALRRVNDDVKVGQASESAVGPAVTAQYYAEYMDATARADLMLQWTYLVSLVGSDPVIASAAQHLPAK